MAKRVVTALLVVFALFTAGAQEQGVEYGFLVWEGDDPGNMKAQWASWVSSSESLAGITPHEVYFHLTNQEDRIPDGTPPLLALLDLLGSRGWELMQVVPGGRSSAWVMKRSTP